MTVSRRDFVDLAARAALLGSLGTTLATRRASAAAAAATPRRFTERQRRTLAALADTIVPAGDGMPSASEAGALPYLQSLAAREPGLGRDLRGALAIAERRSRTRYRAACDVLGAQQRVDLLQAMEKEAADAFRLLRDLVYEAYYTQAAVWKALGYEFIGASQSGPPLPPFEDALLERVRALPRLYREAP